MWLRATLGQVSTFAHFGPLTPRGSPWSRWRVCPWGTAPGTKASEPLSDPDQLLSIAKYDPNVNAKQVVGVCSTQQRLVYPLPHTSHTRCPRWDAPPWPRWEVSGRMLHQEKYLEDLRDFFSDDGGDCGDKRVARSLGRWRVVLASKSPEATSVQTVLARKLVLSF